MRKQYVSTKSQHKQEVAENSSMTLSLKHKAQNLAEVEIVRK